jgi:dolichol-phosphate mannosyltransferase
MKVVVIIPTYNERLNIGALVTALQKQFQKIPHDMHILVVDDHSPEGDS